MSPGSESDLETPLMCFLCKLRVRGRKDLLFLRRANTSPSSVVIIRPHPPRFKKPSHLSPSLCLSSIGPISEGLVAELEREEGGPENGLLGSNSDHQHRNRWRRRITGFLSEIGTKLRDWAVGQAGGSCYSWAALSSNDSKTL